MPIQRSTRIKKYWRLYQGVVTKHAFERYHCIDGNGVEAEKAFRLVNGWNRTCANLALEGEIREAQYYWIGEEQDG